MKITDILRDFESDFDVVHGRSKNLTDAEFLERLPIAEHNGGVDERNFHAIVECFLLLFRKLRAEIRNHHVPAGHDEGFRSRRIKFPVAEIGYADFFGGGRIAGIAHANYYGTEAYSNRRIATIQPTIIEFCHNDVFGRGPRSDK